MAWHSLISIWSWLLPSFWKRGFQRDTTEIVQGCWGFFPWKVAAAEQRGWPCLPCLVSWWSCRWHRSSHCAAAPWGGAAFQHCASKGQERNYIKILLGGLLDQSLSFFKSHVVCNFWKVCSVCLFTALRDIGVFCAGKNRWWEFVASWWTSDPECEMWCEETCFSSMFMSVHL